MRSPKWRGYVPEVNFAARRGAHATEAAMTARNAARCLSSALRPALAKAYQVTGVLQAPQLRAEVAVGHVQLLLESRETDLAMARQQHGDG